MQIHLILNNNFHTINTMKQAEKLTSAVYLIKSAGMQEKLNGAVHYLKNMFDSKSGDGAPKISPPASDKQVWDSIGEAADAGDLSIGGKNMLQIHGLAGMGAIGGALLGRKLGAPLGARFLKNLSRKLGLKSYSRMGRSNHLFRELNDPAFAEKMKNEVTNNSRAAGGTLGLLGGLVTGQIAGGLTGIELAKSDIIKQLREKGYPKNQ